MATNIYNLSTLVGQGVVAGLHSECKFLNTVSTDYKKDFEQTKYKPGLTLQVNKGPQFQVTTGRVADVQNVEFDSTSFTVVQYNEAISLTSLEQGYDLDDDYDMMRLGRDMADRMGREMERIGLQTVAINAGISEGSPGSEPGSMRLFNRILAKMDDALAPSRGRYVALSPLANVELIDVIQKLPNPGPEISNAFLRRKLSDAGDANFYTTPSVYRATLGSATNTTPLVNGAVTDNSSTIAIDGLSAATATIKKGTKFTIGVLGTATAVQAVDPETKATLPYLKEFTVTADATGSGSAIASLAISPTIRGSASQHQNVSQLPPNDAEIVLKLGTTAAGATYGQNVVYQENAVQMVGLSLPAAKGPKVHSFSDFRGIPIRTGVGSWDAKNDDQILRLDAVVAFFLTRPDHCGVALGA